MTITDKEIREDFQRFIRHEAMRANCMQEDIVRILCKENFGIFLQYCKIKKKVQDGQTDNS